MKRKTSFFILLAMIALTLSGCVNVITNKSSGPVIKKTLPQKEFSNLNVSSDISDIELHIGKNYRVVYNGPKKFMPNITNNNGNLSIKNARMVTLIGDITINSKNDPTVIIYMPKKELNNLKMTSDDGDIDLYDNIRAKNAHLTSDDGDITTDTLVADSAYLHSDDGDVTIAKLLTRHGAEATSDDGDVEIKSSNATGYHLSSDDGDVTFRGHDEDDDDDGGYYRSHLSSSNVLTVHNDDGDVTVR